MKYETLEGEEVIKIMRGEEIQKSTLGDLLDDDRSKPVLPAGDALPASGEPEGPQVGPLPQPG